MLEELIAIANIIPERAVTVILDERGATMNSAAFAGRLQEWRAADRPALVFILGGADGLAPSLRDKADLALAFGAFTWPHQLVADHAAGAALPGGDDPGRTPLSSGVSWRHRSAAAIRRESEYLVGSGPGFGLRPALMQSATLRVLAPLDPRLRRRSCCAGLGAGARARERSRAGAGAAERRDSLSAVPARPVSPGTPAKPAARPPSRSPMRRSARQGQPGSRSHPDRAEAGERGRGQAQARDRSDRRGPPPAQSAADRHGGADSRRGEPRWRRRRTGSSRSTPASRRLRQSLEERRGVMAEVLAALQRIGRHPPPALMVTAQDALQSLRSAMMLGAVLPEMRHEADLLDRRSRRADARCARRSPASATDCHAISWPWAWNASAWAS